jgi:hypothetical protein
VASAEQNGGGGAGVEDEKVNAAIEVKVRRAPEVLALLSPTIMIRRETGNRDAR